VTLGAVPDGTMPGLLASYASAAGAGHDDVMAGGAPRAEFARLATLIDRYAPSEFARLQALADLALLRSGVTFSVYSDDRGSEKVLPFCLIPRPVAAAEFARLERGLAQRIAALGLFLDDVYGPQRIFADGTLPADVVLAATGYIPSLRGVRPPGGVRLHVAGVDLIRDGAGTWRVLEDNLRVPSGVSYVLEGRLTSKRVIPHVLDAARVQPVDQYPARLAHTLRAVAPRGAGATAVVLTPGPYNSAYYEHAFLARTMGLELVHGADLFVDDDRVWMRTTRGPQAVDVIYRRIDDAFLDPDAFRADSVLGVRGLMRAYAAGNVSIANAPGNGVADDKAVYALVPTIIRYYLGETPLLEQVPTYACYRADDCAYVLEHLGDLVVKAVDEAGGYGMLMGPQASAAERADFAARIRAQPRKYIAQPRVELSTAPTWIAERGRVEPRRVDLRPYVLTSPDGPWVLPGGLTRVALANGSYVVNSSQGGGSKDTWVLREGSPEPRGPA
jgi:uncharacterized circularly permuted ATP-grasp superfamily protein